MLYKVKYMGINGKFLKLIESFLNNRYQRVLLNGQASFWADVKAVVSQGSIRSLILFICVNALSENQLSFSLHTIDQYFMLLRTTIHQLKF